MLQGVPLGTAVAQADLRHIFAYLQTKLFYMHELYFNRANERLMGTET